jgi:hypothetical protein
VGLLTLDMSETVNVRKLNLSGLCIQRAANWTNPWDR